MQLNHNCLLNHCILWNHLPLAFSSYLSGKNEFHHTFKKYIVLAVTVSVYCTV